MTNEQTHGKNTVTPQELEWERLNTLDTLRTGGSYTINPGMSLYPTEEIGQPSVLADGGKLRVAAEFAVPREAEPDKRISRFDFFAVISSEDKGVYAIAGLEPDKSGTMRMTTFDPSNWLYPGGPTQLIIGRDIAKGAHNPNKIWGSGKGYGPATSPEHIVFSLNPDGSLQVKTPGSNGTWGEFGHIQDSLTRNTVIGTLGPAAAKGEVAIESSKERRRKALFEPLEEHSTATVESEDDDTDIKKYIDIMFNGTDEEIEAYFNERALGTGGKESAKFWPATEQTKHDAVGVLRRVLESPYQKYKEKLTRYGVDLDDSNLPALVDKIRTDCTMRLAFGNLLLDDIERAANIDGYLPDRVQRNTGKGARRKMSQVNDLTSQEYVALMCLAKIDGTFDRASLNSTDRNILGDMNRQGQHNRAADIILGID